MRSEVPSRSCARKPECRESCLQLLHSDLARVQVVRRLGKSFNLYSAWSRLRTLELADIGLSHMRKSLRGSGAAGPAGLDDALVGRQAHASSFAGGAAKGAGWSI